MFVLNEWPLSGARLATGVSNCGGERSDRFLDFTLGNPTSDAHGKRISFLHRQVCGFRRSLVDGQA
jgi:hypothetical protein